MRSEHVLPSVVVVSQREIIKRLGLPQPKVSRIIASVTKSLKGKVSQLRLALIL